MGDDRDSIKFCHQNVTVVVLVYQTANFCQKKREEIKGRVDKLQTVPTSDSSSNYIFRRLATLRARRIDRFHLNLRCDLIFAHIRISYPYRISAPFYCRHRTTNHAEVLICVSHSS